MYIDFGIAAAASRIASSFQEKLSERLDYRKPAPGPRAPRVREDDALPTAPAARRTGDPALEVATVSDLATALGNALAETHADNTTPYLGDLRSDSRVATPLALALKLAPDSASKDLLGDLLAAKGKAKWEKSLAALKGYVQGNLPEILKPNTPELSHYANALANLLDGLRKAVRIHAMQAHSSLSKLKKAQVAGQVAALRSILSDPDYKLGKDDLSASASALLDTLLPALSQEGLAPELRASLKQARSLLSRSLAQGAWTPAASDAVRQILASVLDTLGKEAAPMDVGVPKGTSFEDALKHSQSTHRTLDLMATAVQEAYDGVKGSEYHGDPEKPTEESVDIDFGAGGEDTGALPKAPETKLVPGNTGTRLRAPEKGTLLDGTAVNQDGEEVALKGAVTQGRHVNHEGTLFVEAGLPGGEEIWIAWTTAQGTATHPDGRVDTLVSTHLDTDIPTTPTAPTADVAALKKEIEELGGYLLLEDHLSDKAPLWDFPDDGSRKVLDGLAKLLRSAKAKPPHASGLEAALGKQGAWGTYDRRKFLGALESLVSATAAGISLPAEGAKVTTRLQDTSDRLDRQVREQEERRIQKERDSKGKRRRRQASFRQPESVAERAKYEEWDELLESVQDAVEELLASFSKQHPLLRA